MQLKQHKNRHGRYSQHSRNRVLFKYTEKNKKQNKAKVKQTKTSILCSVSFSCFIKYQENFMNSRLACWHWVLFFFFSLNEDHFHRYYKNLLMRRWHPAWMTLPPAPPAHEYASGWRLGVLCVAKATRKIRLCPHSVVMGLPFWTEHCSPLVRTHQMSCLFYKCFYIKLGKLLVHVLHYSDIQPQLRKKSLYLLHFVFSDLVLR